MNYILYTILVPAKKKNRRKKGEKNRGSTRIFSQRESAESRVSESFVASSTLSSLPSSSSSHPLFFTPFSLFPLLPPFFQILLFSLP